MVACVRARWRANAWELIQEERRGEASRRKAGGRRTDGARFKDETHARHGAIHRETLLEQAIRQTIIRQAIRNATRNAAILEASLGARGGEACVHEAGGREHAVDEKGGQAPGE